MWLVLLMACSEPPIPPAYVVEQAKIPVLPSTATNLMVGGEVGFQEDLLYMRFVVPDEASASEWPAEVPCTPQPIERLRDEPFRVSQPDVAPWLLVQSLQESTACIREATETEPKVKIRLDPLADGRHAIQLSCVTL